MSDVTQILSAIEAGNTHASDKLLPLVYDELRNLAKHQLRSEASGHSLQPTALVHEAYVRLVDCQNEPSWKHRGHFYAAAAEAMRRILVESARRKKTLKRGGEHERVVFAEAELVSPLRDPDLLALDEALTKLANERSDLAELVSLRYFAGLSMKQAANAMGLSLRTAERNWTFAKAWLLGEVRGEGQGSSFSLP